MLAGITGYVMLGISLLYALTMLYVALKKTDSTAKPMKILRITVLISFVMFIVDYLLGSYSDEITAMRSFVTKMFFFAIYGILLLALSGIALVITKFVPLSSSGSSPDTKRILRCFLHGFVTALVAFVMRWLMMGSI